MNTDMINYLWGGMVVIGIIVAAFTGSLPDVTNAVIESGKEAIALCLTVMLGIIMFWSGIMRIASDAGLIKKLSKLLTPALSWLFPDVPKGHKALEHISTNMCANFLGLGWAATPPGIKAMQQLQTLNKSKTTASRAMCMFMIVNISSLQLISINLIAYRAQYNSANPTEILVPGIMATIITTIVGIMAAKIFEKVSKLRGAS